jgi:hypothetical protein
MNIEELKQETMMRLSITDRSVVDYITEELLIQYLDAKAVKEVKRQSVDENGYPVENQSYVDYGHSLVFTRAYTYYSNGPQGSNYKCGDQDQWQWRNDVGDEFTPIALCRGNDYYYKLYCPSC